METISIMNAFNFLGRAFKKLLCVVLALAVFMPSNLSSYAQESEETKLKAGYFGFDGYHNLDESGVRSGYGYDLLQLIARYANVQFSYPGYDITLNECLDLLEKGEIDLVTAVKKTKEREERFDFSARNVGVVTTILTVKAGNNAIHSGDYATYEGIRIGVMKDGLREYEMDNFAIEKGFSYQAVHYDNTKQMSQALQNGEIDALVSSSLRSRSNEWTIDSFNESQIFVAVQKGDMQTLSIINQALDRMEIEEYHWRTDLELKYYTSMQSSLPYFTKEEQEYLYSEKAIGRVYKVLVSPERYPYSYIDNGKIVGIMPDLFDLIADIAGIEYEWIIPESREDYVSLMQNRQTDICIDLTPDYDSAEKLGYRITDTYLSAPFSWIRRNQTSNDIRLAARLIYSSNTPAQYAIDQNYHNIEYISYPTIEECLQSVVDGTTDAYCTYTFNAEAIILSDLTGQLMTTVAQNENRFAIGITSDHDFRLTTILNTVIDCIEDWQRTEIIRRHTQFSAPDYTLKDLLVYDRRMQMLAVSIVACAVLLVLTIAQQFNHQRSLRSTIHRQKVSLNASLQNMLDILATAIEFRSSESGAHVQRTRSTVLALLRKLKKDYPKEFRFSEDTMVQIANAAILHDVGKIAIPDHILNKPGKLTKEEFETIKLHTIRGCDLLENIPDMHHEPLYRYAWDICRWHHERWDGSGYPEGLSGENIPIWAQVAGIADVFDALTSARVYKTAYSPEKAMEMIINGECGSFNPKLLKAFSEISGQLETPGYESDAQLNAAPASRSTTTLLLTAFQTFLETTDSLVFIKDTELVFRAVSPHFAKSVGIPPEKILHHTESEILNDPRLIERFYQEDRKLLETGQTFVGPLEKISDKDGLSSYGFTTKQLIKDSQGRTMGILGVTKDVTAQYHALKHHEISLNYLNRLPDDMYFFVAIDVNDWLIVGEKRQSLHSVEFDEHKSVEEFASKAFSRVCDRRGAAFSFYKNFTSSHLLTIAEKNRSRIIMEYIREMPTGVKKWVRDEINFLTEPLTGHLCITIAVYDIQAKKDEEQALIRRSERDELTGLLNRSSLRSLADEILLRNDDCKHALFLIDIDNFKLVNDTLGHPAGDRFLAKMSKILIECFRSSDLIGRIGGDEFIVLMTNITGKDYVESKAKQLTNAFSILLDAALDAASLSASEKDIDAALERAINSSADLRPALRNGHSPRVSASIGIALSPTDGVTREELYGHADEAMYKVKLSGKNQYLFYDEMKKN